MNCLIKVNCLGDGCERMNLLRNWVIVVFDNKDVIEVKMNWLYFDYNKIYFEMFLFCIMFRN